MRQAIEITDQDRKYAETIYPLVQEQMRGLYKPNRGSMFCSRSACPYWQTSEVGSGGSANE